MYVNLEAEIARKRLSKKQIYESASMSYKTGINKLTGKSEISLKQAYDIRDTFFPEHDIKYLFAELFEQKGA